MKYIMLNLLKTNDKRKDLEHSETVIIPFHRGKNWNDKFPSGNQGIQRKKNRAFQLLQEKNVSNTEFYIQKIFLQNERRLNI